VREWESLDWYADITTGISGTADYPVVDNTTNIKATIYNSGDFDLTDVPFAVYNGAELIVQDTIDVTALDSASINIEFTPTEIGEYTFSVTADENNIKIESNDTNNTSTTVITVYADSDEDGVADIIDACPGFDDNLDADSDEIPDDCDNCPNIANQNQTDSDGDTVGDLCDNCLDIANQNQIDSDGDTLGDSCDNCPYYYNPLQKDSDDDGIGDSCEYPINFYALTSPQYAPDSIKAGSLFTVDIYMNNDYGSVIAYSWPLCFYSPDLSIQNVTHWNVGGYSAQTIDYPPANYCDSSILMLNGYDTLWSNNLWYGFSWDGKLPDTINHYASSTHGWPSGLGEHCYIQFAFKIDEPGIFCIDSIKHPLPQYDWLFDFPTEFNGPYCWTIFRDGYICGDADGSGTINILDVTHIINYLYKGGPAPDPVEAGDANGSGGINILDVTHIINYLYKGGEPPVCP